MSMYVRVYFLYFFNRFQILRRKRFSIPLNILKDCYFINLLFIIIIKYYFTFINNKSPDFNDKTTKFILILLFLSASFFTPCSKSDPQLSECVQKVISVSGSKFTEGIPELGIAKLDPVELGTVVVDNPSLKITFADTVVTGLKDFKVNNYK